MLYRSWGKYLEKKYLNQVKQRAQGGLSIGITTKIILKYHGAYTTHLEELANIEMRKLKGFLVNGSMPSSPCTLPST